VRILIATPVFQLYSQTVAATLLQDWDGGTRDYVLAQDDDLSLSHYARITAKFNRLRTLALAGGYDALLVVEADMLPPFHALRCLLDTEADVAYGAYCFRHDSMRGLWNVAATLYPDGHADWLMAYEAQARDLAGKVVRCQGVGLGCTLIRRRVLDAVPFRDNDRLHCDWFLGMDAAAAGFSQVAHLGVLCGHIQDKTRAIWPDPLADNLYRVATPAEGY
jgi:hypothetical protein